MMIIITKKVYADFKNIKIYRLYGRDNTKQVSMSYFHCGPFRKSKKKKRKERLDGSKNFVRSGSKRKVSKKRERDINDDNNNDIISK